MRDSINDLVKNLKSHQNELKKFESYTEFDRGLFAGNIELLERLIFDIESILPKNYELIKMKNKIIFQDLGIEKLSFPFKHMNGWQVDSCLYPQIDVKNQIIFLRGLEKEKDCHITVINCEDDNARNELFDILSETLKEYEIQCNWEKYINK